VSKEVNLQKGDELMAQENVTLIQSMYEAFVRGDIPTVLGAMDPNIEWDQPEAPGYPSAGIHRVPQAVVNEVFGTIPTYYQEFAAVPQEFIDVGDRVIVIGAYQGKGKASGTPFVAPFVHIHTFRNGTVVRFQEYTDTGTIAAAIK
jgi:ketosteroid isomerase-like protein